MLIQSHILGKKVLRMLTKRPANFYHIDDIMSRNYMERNSLIFLPASHLYLDKLLNQPFHEREFVNLLVEYDKKNEKNWGIYDRMFEFLEGNIDQITNFETLSTVYTTAYFIKFKNRKILIKMAERGFDLYQNSVTVEGKAYSFHCMRIMIGIQALLGLSTFPNQKYEIMKLKEMKPLFLLFFLQLFWKDNLQDQYPIVEKILNILISQEDLIPYSDVHHMVTSTKYIRDPRYNDLIQRVQNRMKKEVEKNSDNSDRVDPEVVNEMYKEYIDDLERKYL